ncbi:MAG: transglutaminase domain-containing protein [Eubacterium sp.]|nr:transglutaminase domain-containing protein [Eubacterium sp.]
MKKRTHWIIIGVLGISLLVLGTVVWMNPTEAGEQVSSQVKADTDGNTLTGHASVNPSDDFDRESAEFSVVSASGSASTMLSAAAAASGQAVKTDWKPPKIKGFVGKNSYNQGIPYMVVYSNDRHYDYFKYVRAKDNKDRHPKLTVDTSKVNFNKPGIYKIRYRAEDKAGNVSHKKARIEVRVYSEMDRLADDILSRITQKNWSKFKKATAIYDYTRRIINYVNTSDKSDWQKEAVKAMTFGTGDCFTYYSLARALLTRVGIPNIEVTRYRGEGHHWWNMVYVRGGWYHYDCFPRMAGDRYCMITDDQLKEYSRTHGNKYIWNYKALPKSAKKIITQIHR